MKTPTTHARTAAALIAEYIPGPVSFDRNAEIAQIVQGAIDAAAQSAPAASGLNLAAILADWPPMMAAAVVYVEKYAAGLAAASIGDVGDARDLVHRMRNALQVALLAQDIAEHPDTPQTTGETDGMTPPAGLGGGSAPVGLIEAATEARDFLGSLLDLPPVEASDALGNNGEDVERTLSAALLAALPPVEVAAKRARLAELEAVFAEQGGRGVEIADEIDELRRALCID